MPVRINKSKRRRYIRYTIDLSALFIIDDTQVLECRILDFCTGGFYLSIDKNYSDIALHSQIIIRFSIPQGLGVKTYEVRAQIMHIGPKGVGVGVVADNMPADTYKALKTYANLHVLSIPPEGQAIASQKQIKDAFKHSLIDGLRSLIERFLAAIGECLEAANAHSEFFPNVSAFDDLMTTLKLNKDIISSEFCCSVAYQVDHIANQSDKDSSPLEYESLSLIEKEDFEDWLNMAASIRRLKNDFDEELNQLISQLCRVFGLPEYALTNPISPAVLCDSFRDVFLQIESSAHVKKVIYDCFEQTLVSELPGFYRQAILTLSKFESAKVLMPGYGSQNDRHPKTKPENEEAYFSNYRDTDEGSRHSSVQPLNQITGKLLNILSNTVNASNQIHRQADSHSDNNFSSAFNPAEILTAIAHVQRDLVNNLGARIDSATLQKHLTDKLRDSHADAKSLSVKDVNSLEIYGDFFDVLASKFGDSSEIKQYLDSIYLPLLSLPLQGNDFLDADTHPARKILNQLAILEPAIKNNRMVKNTNVKDTVEKAIARISSESLSNPHVFEEVEHELDEVTKKLSQSIDHSIKRITEPYDGQQKLELARQAIQREIDARIAGRSVPAVIPALLDAGWQDLLVIAELNKETNPDEKQSYLKVIDDLLFWLYEQESFLTMQTVSIHSTLKFIEENLGEVCPTLFKRDSVIEELFCLLIGTGVPKTRKPMDTVRIPATTAETGAVAPGWAAQVDALQVGEWLIIYRDSEGFVPMKLVWIGDVLPICVFVNRDGLTKFEISKSELALLLENGGANRIESLDVPLMDRATNQMLQNMHTKLVYSATHDAETDLLTKDEFIKQLKTELVRLDNTSHLVCHIEVLDFRIITNICGVEGGKQFLQTLTDLIRKELREYDLCARIGDKSFAVLFKNCTVEQGNHLCKQLLTLIGESRFQWQGKSYSIGVSMGLVPFDLTNFDIYEILQHADAASMSAERSGHNNLLLFTQDDETLKRQHKIYEWIGNIDKVFSENRLFLRCQMIAAIDSTGPNHQHYEILLGIKDENDHIIPPDHFIPAVERCKRMPEIDEWVIKNVLHWIENNRKYFDLIDGFAINLSGQSINSQAFLEFLKGALQATSVPTDKLIFEVTETVAAESYYLTNSFIKAIKQFNCKFSLDDFGSGYSSYSYLKNLNIDYLKIDGAFVKDILNNKADVAIVKSMNEIAHSLGLATIAEYVESDEIREVLKTIGVDFAQGYAVHKPSPLSELVIAAPSTPYFSFEDTEFWGF